MKAHFLQHVPFEGLGYIETWLKKMNYPITSTKLYKYAHLPKPEIEKIFPRMDSFDLLIIMGGPMSVNDEQEFIWLQPEKKFIREAIQAGKKVLGICLGAQLIANALGAKVYPNKVKEIGWLPIQSNIESNIQNNIETNIFPDTNQPIEVFHWHGETFDLPDNAHLLARSDACAHQAFQIGKSVIGLQFHLETTPQSAADIVQHCADELTEGPYIQSQEQILTRQPDQYKEMHQLMENVLSILTNQ